MQEGPVPAMGHHSGSDPAPTSAGNAYAYTKIRELAQLVACCIAYTNLVEVQPYVPHPDFSQVSRPCDAMPQYESSSIAIPINSSLRPFAGAIGVDTHLDPVPGIHTAHPDTDMKVKDEKTSGASPSDEAMAAIQPHKPNHEVAASADAAAHGQSSVLPAESLLL